MAQTTNSTLVLLYWKMGYRINEEVLQNKRADYGKQIIATVAQQLVQKFGKGWDVKIIRHCLRSAETFSEKLNISAARTQLSFLKTNLEIITGNNV